MSLTDKYLKRKFTPIQGHTKNYERADHTGTNTSNIRSYQIINQHPQSTLFSNKTLSGDKGQNDFLRMYQMGKPGIPSGRETGTGFQRSTTSGKNREHHIRKESLPSHVLGSIDEFRDELYTTLKIDNGVVHKRLKDSIEELLAKFKMKLTNEWPDFITDYSNKFSQTKEELKRFEKELKEKSQENDTMKSHLSFYKKECERLKNEKLMNEKLMNEKLMNEKYLNSIINKYENKSTMIQSLQEEVKECKETINNLCNQIFDTHEALNIYCQQLGKAKIDEQYIQNLKREEERLIKLINKAKHKFDSGIKGPLKLELPQSHIPTHYEVKILENQVKQYSENYNEAMRKIRTLEGINRDLENKYKETDNRLRQFNDYNMRPTNYQPTTQKKDIYIVQYAPFDKSKDTIGYNKKFYDPHYSRVERPLEPVNNDDLFKKYNDMTIKLQEKEKEISRLGSDLQGERTTNEELRNEVGDLKEEQRRLALRYPKPHYPTKNKIDQVIEKFNSPLPKIRELATIIKARKEENKGARKVILDLHKKYLSSIDDTKMKLNNKVKEIRKQLINEKNKSNDVAYVKNWLEEILNISLLDNNIKEPLNKVRKYIEDLKDRNERLDTDGKNILNEKIALEEEIKQLNDTILEHEKQIENNTLKIKEKDTKYNKLLKEFNDLKRKPEVSDKVEDLKRQNEDLKDENKSLIEQNDELVSKYKEIESTLQDEIAKLESENTNLRDELDKLKDTKKPNPLTESSDPVDEYKRENAKLKDENKELAQRLYRLDIGERYGILEKTNTQLRERIERENKLKKEMSELKEKYEGLKKIKDEEQKEFAAENRYIQDRLERFIPSQPKGESTPGFDLSLIASEELKSEANELRKALEESEENIKKQKEEMNELKNKYDKLATESAKKSSTITKLQLDMESLESQIREYEQTIAEYENASA